MQKKREQSSQIYPTDRVTCTAGTTGFCRICGQEHVLSALPAQKAALQLIKTLEQVKRVDLSCPSQHADPRCSADYLWGPARGKMFGVMVAQATQITQVRQATTRETVYLKAFSGQYNGLWQIPGWVGPVFDLKKFHQVHDAKEREIKKMTVTISKLRSGAEDRQQLVRLRKKKSQQLMRKIHQLYQLQNFHRQVANLEQVFAFNMDKKGLPPTGTGDCCAPKLLQHAAVHELTPLGLAEFYFGKENAAGTRQHGHFYPSCSGKCYPILGFMLCGLEGKQGICTKH